MKNYISWLKAAAIFQFLTAIIHVASLFITPVPANDTEKQLYNLMDTYKFDFGAGFYRTMNELMLPLSACLTLLCLLGGMINWYLLKKKTDSAIMKGIININLIVFGISFILTAKFAFLPPIILMGLIVLFLIVARIKLNSQTIE